MSNNIKKLFTIFLLFSIVVATGCDNSEYQKQIGDFQTAIDESRSALESYYLEMNQFERDIYILRRETNSKLSLGIIYGDMASTDNPLDRGKDALYVNGPFTPASIKARLDSLKLIGLYGKRLAELAGTDSPAVFESGTSALGQNISNLTNTFRQLSGSGTDKTAASYIPPISTLVSIVGRLYLERKRDKALTEGIQQGSRYITQITGQLKIDFAEIIKPLKGTGLTAQISTLLQNYEDEREKITRNDRKKLLAEINSIVRTYELFVAADTLDVIQSLEDANQALLLFANSGMKRTGFTQVVARVGEFRDKAKQIAEIIKEIREIRRELKDANR